MVAGVEFGVVVHACAVEARLTERAVVGAEDGLGPVAGDALVDCLVVLVASGEAEPDGGVIAEACGYAVLGVVAGIAEAVGRPRSRYPSRRDHQPGT